MECCTNSSVAGMTLNSKVEIKSLTMCHGRRSDKEDSTPTSSISRIPVPLRSAHRSSLFDVSKKKFENIQKDISEIRKEIKQNADDIQSIKTELLNLTRSLSRVYGRRL